MYAESSSTIPSESSSDMLPKSSSKVLPESSSSKVLVNKCSIEPIKLLAEVKCPSPDSAHLNLIKKGQISNKSKMESKSKYDSFKNGFSITDELLPSTSLNNSSVKRKYTKNASINATDLSNPRFKNKVRTLKCESQSSIKPPSFNGLDDRPNHSHIFKKGRGRPRKQTTTNKISRELCLSALNKSLMNNILKQDYSNSYPLDIGIGNNMSKPALPAKYKNQSSIQSSKQSLGEQVNVNDNEDVHKLSFSCFHETSVLDKSNMNIGLYVDKRNRPMGLSTDISTIKKAKLTPKTKSTTLGGGGGNKLMKDKCSYFAAIVAKIERPNYISDNKLKNLFDNETKSECLISPIESIYLHASRAPSITMEDEVAGLGINALDKLNLHNVHKSKSGYFKPFVRRRGIAWLLNFSKQAIVVKSSMCRAGKYHHGCKNQTIKEESNYKITDNVSHKNNYHVNLSQPETTDQGDDDFSEINDKYTFTKYKASKNIRKQNHLMPEKRIKVKADYWVENSNSNKQQIFNNLICNDSISVQDLRYKNQLSINRLDKRNLKIDGKIVKCRGHRSRKLAKKQVDHNYLGFSKLKSSNDSSNYSMRLKPSLQEVDNNFDTYRVCNDSSSEQYMKRYEEGSLILESQFNTNKFDKHDIKIDSKLINQQRVNNFCKSNLNQHKVYNEDCFPTQDLKCEEESTSLDNQLILNRLMKNEGKISLKFVKRRRGRPKKLIREIVEFNKLNLFNFHPQEITNISSNPSYLNLNQQEVDTCPKTQNDDDVILSLQDLKYEDESSALENKSIYDRLWKRDLTTDFKFVKRRRSGSKKVIQKRLTVNNSDFLNCHSQEMSDPQSRSNFNKLDFTHKSANCITFPRIQNEFYDSVSIQSSTCEEESLIWEDKPISERLRKHVQFVKRRRGRPKKLDCKRSVVNSLNSFSSYEITNNLSNSNKLNLKHQAISTCLKNQNNKTCHSIHELKYDIESPELEKRLISDRLGKHNLNIDLKFKQHRSKSKRLMRRCPEYNNMNLVDSDSQEIESLNKPSQVFLNKHIVDTFTKTQKLPDYLISKQIMRCEEESSVLENHLNFDRDRPIGQLGKEDKKFNFKVLKGRNGWPRKLSNRYNILGNASLPYSISPEISGHSNNFSYIQPKYNYFKPYVRRPGIAWLSNISTQLLPCKKNTYTGQILPKCCNEICLNANHRSKLCDTKVIEEIKNKELKSYSCVGFVQTRNFLLKKEIKSQNEQEDTIPAKLLDERISFQKDVTEESRCDSDNMASNYLTPGTLFVDVEPKLNQKKEGLFLKRKRGRPRKNTGKDFKSDRKFVDTVSKQLKSYELSKKKNFMNRKRLCRLGAVIQTAEKTSHASFSQLEDRRDWETLNLLDEEKLSPKLDVNNLNEKKQSRLLEPRSSFLMPSTRRPGISWLTNFQSNAISGNNHNCEAGKLLQRYNSRSYRSKSYDARQLLVEPKLSKIIKRKTSGSDILKNKSSALKSTSTPAINGGSDAGVHFSSKSEFQRKKRISNYDAIHAENYLQPNKLCTKNKPYLIQGHMGGPRKINNNKTFISHSLLTNKNQSFKLSDAALICKEVQVTLNRLEVHNYSYGRDDKAEEQSSSHHHGDLRTTGIESNPQYVKKRGGRPRKICKNKGMPRTAIYALSQKKLKGYYSVPESDCISIKKISRCSISNSDAKFDVAGKNAYVFKKKNGYFLPSIRRPGIAWLSGILNDKLFVKKKQCLAGKILQKVKQMLRSIPLKMEMTRSIDMSKPIPLYHIDDASLHSVKILSSQENNQCFYDTSLVKRNKSSIKSRKMPSSSCKKETKNIDKCNNLFVMRRLQFHDNLDNNFDSPREGLRLNVTIINKSQYNFLKPKGSYFKPFLRRPGISWLESQPLRISLISKKAFRTGKILQRKRVCSLHQTIKVPNIHKINCYALDKSIYNKQLESSSSNDLQGTTLCRESSLNQSHSITINNYSTGNGSEPDVISPMKVSVANTSPNNRHRPMGLLHSLIINNAMDSVIVPEVRVSQALKSFHNSHALLTQENSFTKRDVLSETLSSKNLNFTEGGTIEKLEVESYKVASSAPSTDELSSKKIIFLPNIEGSTSKESTLCEKSNLESTFIPSTNKDEYDTFSSIILGNSTTEVESVSRHEVTDSLASPEHFISDSESGNIYLQPLNKKSSGFKPALKFESLTPRSDINSVLIFPECLNSVTESELSEIINQEKEPMNGQLSGSLSNLESSDSEDGVDYEIFSDRGNIFLHQLNKKCKPVIKFDRSARNTECVQHETYNQASTNKVVCQSLNVNSYVADAGDVDEISNQIKTGLNREVTNFPASLNIESTKKNSKTASCESFDQEITNLNPLKNGVPGFLSPLNVNTDCSVTGDIHCKILQMESSVLPSSYNEVCSLSSSNSFSSQGTRNFVGSSKLEATKLRNTGLNIRCENKPDLPSHNIESPILTRLLNRCENKLDLPSHNIEESISEAVILRQGKTTVYSKADDNPICVSDHSKNNFDASSERGAIELLKQFNSIIEYSAFESLLNKDCNSSNSINTIPIISSLTISSTTSELENCSKESISNCHESLSFSLADHDQKNVNAPSECRAITLLKQDIASVNVSSKEGSNCESLSNTMNTMNNCNEITIIGAENDSVNSLTEVIQTSCDKCCIQKNINALPEDRTSKFLNQKDVNVVVLNEELPNRNKVVEIKNNTNFENFCCNITEDKDILNLKPDLTLNLKSLPISSLQESSISDLKGAAHSPNSVLSLFSSDAVGIGTVNRPIQASQKEHILNVPIDNPESLLNSNEDICLPEFDSNDRNTAKELEDTSVQINFLAQASNLAANKFQETLYSITKTKTHKCSESNYDSWIPYEIGFKSAIPVSSIVDEIGYSQACESSNIKTQKFSSNFSTDTISQLDKNINNIQTLKHKKARPLRPVAEKGNCDPYPPKIYFRYRPILPKLPPTEIDIGHQGSSTHRPSSYVRKQIINRSKQNYYKILPVISLSKDSTAIAPSIMPELRVMLNRIPCLLDNELQTKATLNMEVYKNNMKIICDTEGHFSELNSRGHLRIGLEKDSCCESQLFNDSVPESSKVDFFSQFAFNDISKDTLVSENQIQGYSLASHSQKSLPSNDLFTRMIANVPSMSSENPSCFNFQCLSDTEPECSGFEEEVVPSQKYEWLPVIASVISLKVLTSEKLQQTDINVSRNCHSFDSHLDVVNESVGKCSSEVNQALEKGFPDINFPKCISNWKKMFPWMSFESSNLTINCSICRTDNNICKLIASSDAFTVSSKLRAHSTTSNHIVMTICNNNQVYRQICSFLKFYPYYLHSHESLLDNIKKLTHTHGEVTSDMLIILINHIAEVTEEKILSCVKGKFFSLIADNTRRMLILRYLSDADIICEHIFLSYYLSKDNDPMDFIRRKNLALDDLVYCNVPIFLENKMLPVYSKMFPSFSELLQWLSYSKCFIHYDNLIKTFSKYYKKLPHMFAFLKDAHLLNFPTICNLDLFKFIKNNLSILGSIGNEIHKVYGLLEGVGLGNLDLQFDTLQEVIETLSVLSLNFNKILNMKGFPNDENTLATFRHVQFILKEKLSMAFQSANNEKLEAFSIMVIFVLEFCTKNVYTMGQHNTILSNLFDSKKLITLDSDTVDLVYNYVISHYQTSKAALLQEFWEFGTYLLDKKKIMSIQGMLELYQSVPELKVKFPVCYSVYKLISFLPCFPAHRERSFFAGQVLLKFLLPKLSPELCVSLITVYVETDLDSN